MSNIERQKKDNSLNIKNLSLLFEKFPNPIFVTDVKGNILISNSTAAMTMGITLDQFLKSNVNDLVHKNYYDKSYTLEAAEKKRPIRGPLTTALGITMISSSTPVLDDDGEVILVLTTGYPKGINPKIADSDERGFTSRRKREIEYLRSRVFDKTEVVAESPLMRQVLLMAHKIAQTDSSVLLTGESGSGKEVLAKYIHRHSKRSLEAFLAVNCAAFPEPLVESELFGYEKGAFTGARADGKMGLFEAAHRGTLFLDEIAELPLALQSKLLRVLETGEVRRIGSNVGRRIDFRLIAATNKNLEHMTEQGTFRKDLYYRLSVIPVQIPSLRDRPEDIVALAAKFLADFNKKYDADVELDANTLEIFKKQSWPGNVRELRNLIERKVICSLHDYPEDCLQSAATVDTQEQRQGDIFKYFGLSGTLREVLSKVEKKYIDSVLEACGGRIGEAANRLGIYRTVLYRKLKAFEQKE
ncbi:sigma-54 interaction domain-containing protein [Anaeroselena agilis]|uniref:Sigma 54-interacting transcriptional regulator n=1 Tax=Anaeroselena agilis TaxID=3063788 RepID=A0ABU3P0L3_9FIRM|nr:sigma 54-interacting transcriptional regulator [Selenomonadales bacterium 4137-cl]